MKDFYGSLENKLLPAVITDSEFNVIYLNGTASKMAPVRRWIKKGKVVLAEEELAEMREFFLKREAIPFFRMPFRYRYKRYQVLCERVAVGGVTVYIFAFVKGDGVKADEEELPLAEGMDGHRMLNFCFSPCFSEQETHPVFFGDSIRSLALGVMNRLSDKGVKISCVADEECDKGVSICTEAVVACIVSLLMALISVSEDNSAEITVSAHKGGYYVKMKARAKLSASLDRTADCGAVLACFPTHIPHVLAAFGAAERNEMGITAYADGDVAEFCVDVKTYDIGCLGFKSEFRKYDPLENVIISVTEVLG